MNKTYKVKDILNEMRKFENSDIIIKSKNKVLYIKLFKNFTSHLLGLQHTGEIKLSVNETLRFIERFNNSDQHILHVIEKNYGEKNKCRKIGLILF